MPAKEFRSFQKHAGPGHVLEFVPLVAVAAINLPGAEEAFEWNCKDDIDRTKKTEPDRRERVFDD